MQKRTMYTLAFSALVLLLAAGISFYENGISGIIVSDLVAVAAAMIFVAVFKAFYSRNDEPQQDERTRKITQAASTYAWWATYVLIAIMILASQFKLVEIPTVAALSIVMFFTVFSQMILRFYFSRKGDIE